MCGIVGQRFELRRVIGRGGMGCVWLAYDRALRRDVALKEAAGADDAAVRDRVLREARAAARISHPNVVRILDVVDAARRPWIVMEHIPSWSLRDLLAANGPLPSAYAAQVGIAVLDGLTATHRAGILHCDVTPGNILIGHDGRVVLADFGIAQGIEVADAVDGPQLGTPQYVPPERASANLTLPEGDLYSLGATLYMAVEGRGPFDRDSVESTLAALRDSAPDPPRCADDLAAVISGLLRRDPYLRWRPARVRRELVRIARSGAGPRPAAGAIATPVQPFTVALSAANS